MILLQTESDVIIVVIFQLYFICKYLLQIIDNWYHYACIKKTAEDIEKLP